MFANGLEVSRFGRREKIAVTGTEPKSRGRTASAEIKRHQTIYQMNVMRAEKLKRRKAD